MSSAVRAHLVFRDGTVTSNYSEVIEMEATRQPLMEYLTLRNSWTIPVFDTIDWSPQHGTLLKRLKNKRKHLIKFVHDVLPTTGRFNQIDGGHRTRPLCDTLEEDQDHNMRCPHPSRAAWRSGCIRRVHDYCCRETRTYPQLTTRLLVDSLECWFSGNDQPVLDLDQYPADLHPNIRRQHKVG